MPSYLTAEEMRMSREEVNLQTVLGIESCKSREDIIELLDDVREHERNLNCCQLHRFSDADGNP